MPQLQLPSWLPELNPQVWILALGRFLSQTGTGFTLFYAPIFFVNHVGLSATAVGLGLGSAQVSGILGRLLGGSFCDSQFWGRRRTLLLSALVSSLASFILASAHNFSIFIIGNLLMGLGIGLYWPATEAVVADLTKGQQRQEAFALTRVADNLGLQVGIIFGGLLIAETGAYRLLFVIDGISFLVFFGVVLIAISETYQPELNSDAKVSRTQLNGWMVALRDRSLLVFATVNILFTLYISQLQSTMPLYFTNFVSLGASGKGFSTTTISFFFAYYTVLMAVLQLPATRALRRFSHSQALIVSSLLWGMGFILIALTGIATSSHLFLALVGLSVLSVATVSYIPYASSIVADLAPASLRGVYLAINSQCWAIGYLIGPPLGGWALDLGQAAAHHYWLVLAASIGVAIGILQQLDRLLKQ